MAANRPMTREEDEMLRAGHTAGRSLHSLAKEMHRSKQTLATAAQRLGFSFSDPKRTAQTRAATEVAVASNAAKRAAIIARLYRQASDALDRVDGISASKRYRTLTREAGGAQITQSLTFVPSEDLRNTGAYVASLLGPAARLESVTEKSGGEVEGQKSMVSDLLAGIRAQAEK